MYFIATCSWCREPLDLNTIVLILMCVKNFKPRPLYTLQCHDLLRQRLMGHVANVILHEKLPDVAHGPGGRHVRYSRPLGVLDVHLDDVDDLVLVAQHPADVRECAQLPLVLVGVGLPVDPDLVEMDVAGPGC